MANRQPPDLTEKERKDYEVFSAMRHILQAGQAQEEQQRRRFEGTNDAAVPEKNRGLDAHTYAKLEDLCERAHQLDFDLEQKTQPLGDFVNHVSLTVAAILSQNVSLLSRIPFFNPDLTKERARGFYRAIKHFATMVNCFQSDAAGVAEFEKIMSSEQIVSMRILMHWWHSPDLWRIMQKTQKRIILLAAQPDWSLARGVHMDLIDQEGPWTAEAMRAELHRTHMLDVLGLTWRETDVHKSMYHRNMLQLFAMEFVMESRIVFLQSADGDQSRFRRLLHQKRQMCACLTTIKEMAVTSRLPPPTQPPLSELLQKRRRTLLDPVPWLRLQEHFDTNRKADPLANMPHHLWDIANRRTVRTQDLGQPVDYTCISYSWGRWRIPVDREDAFTTIPNVHWKVPRNTRFDVETLPDEFARIFQNQGYLWFDLFVIPQDNSELALREVGRQDIIFTNAKHCIAWLHDVNNWDVLSDALWCSAANLGRNNTPMMPFFGLDASVFKDKYDSRRGTKSLEFYTSTNHLDRPPLRDVLGWLTSLWTLQEVCLRPDMVLCTRDWVPLMVGEHVVTFDGLVASQEYSHSNITGFDDTTRDALGNSVGAPTWGPPIHNAQEMNKPLYVPADGTIDTVEELRRFLVATTGLSELRDLSRSAIFNLAQKRTCVESRAEAIMSVIGATQWYVRYASEQGRQLSRTPLVLGQYPAVFLNEAARNIGAEFFSTMRLDQDYLDVALPGKDIERWTNPSQAIVGSLLPFTTTRTQLCPFPRSMQLSNFMSHESLQSWEVLDDGRVHITNAAIVASSQSCHQLMDTTGSPLTREQQYDANGIMPAKAHTQILVPDFMHIRRENRSEDWEERKRGQMVQDSVSNFQQWLDKEAHVGSKTVYAVCLSQQRRESRDGTASFGVLLKEIGNGSAKGSTSLISVGNFFGCAPMDWFKTYPVDWMVL